MHCSQSLSRTCAGHMICLCSSECRMSPAAACSSHPHINVFVAAAALGNDLPPQTLCCMQAAGRRSTCRRSSVSDHKKHICVWFRPWVTSACNVYACLPSNQHPPRMQVHASSSTARVEVWILTPDASTSMHASPSAFVFVHAVAHVCLVLWHETDTPATLYLSSGNYVAWLRYVVL